MLGVAEFVPTITMAFVGGALADYVDRRRQEAKTRLWINPEVAPTFWTVEADKSGARVGPQAQL